MPIVDVNGQQFEFPDTMSGDEIKSVLKKISSTANTTRAKIRKRQF